MKLPKKYLSNIPLLALTAANVIPLFGVFLTIALGSPLGVLIALKTIIDVKLHLWEHKKAKL